MQIGNPQVPILGAIAGKVPPRTEPRLADEFEPRLEGVADIRIEAMNRGATIDEENGEGADLLSCAIRRRVAEQARMRLQHETAAPTLIGCAFRHDNRTAAALLNRQDDHSVLRAPDPIDQRPLCALWLAVLAELLRQRLRKQDRLRQRRFGSIVAPGDVGFDRRDVRIEQDRQTNRRWQEPPASVGRLRLLVIGRGAANAVRIRLLDVEFHLFLGGRIALVVIPVERERILRGREKSGQIPARRALVQAFVGEIGILRAWADQVATKNVHDMGAHIDRVRHDRPSPSEINNSPRTFSSHLVV